MHLGGPITANAVQAVMTTDVLQAIAVRLPSELAPGNERPLLSVERPAMADPGQGVVTCPTRGHRQTKYKSAATSLHLQL